MDRKFPISRDPPEGGTSLTKPAAVKVISSFPISRDPPEGGTLIQIKDSKKSAGGFQFLGIPPKGELKFFCPSPPKLRGVSNF